MGLRGSAAFVSSIPPPRAHWNDDQQSPKQEADYMNKPRVTSAQRPLQAASLGGYEVLHEREMGTGVSPTATAVVLPDAGMSSPSKPQAQSWGDPKRSSRALLFPTRLVRPEPLPARLVDAATSWGPSQPKPEQRFPASLS
jgi:hypothetical protein